MKVLANDGLSQPAIDKLTQAGFEVLTTRVAQEQLSNFIITNQIKALLVRSATQVDKKTIDAAPSLELIGRAGVGMDNIDVAYARQKGIQVVNTPAASSISVAELVFAHLLGAARFLHDANRNMPLEGDQRFKQLKKDYGKGLELKGKTLGIIGFGRIGKEVAKIAMGMGMQVLFHDKEVASDTLDLSFFDGQSVSFELEGSPLEELLGKSDFISLNVPATQNYVLGQTEMAQMKKGVGIVNCARGGVLDEVALVDALENGIVAFAGLDVFESEPQPEIRILMHPNISLSPHIGGATIEAQERIGLELAERLIDLLKTPTV
ncbi:D-2-hydroxyacid dehydrogenase [Sediminicola luteus]|uniref:3-phosphoglycerate dehydrogenase n=1 Tax=Sediminicola luteus TaxID=319238 RepID=A0A2A4G867_9FLAO|nr:D-2-hydroxyacid dehydrogenase [Sediminicola luteus]PCE64186.1 3-phosphoglycerate dehydrogenase [Sediminicola luteus]